MIGNGMIALWDGLGGAIIAGAWVPWDVLVSNQPGVGDYNLISAACAAEPAGTIIAVDSNAGTPYVELIPIVPLAGQSIFALDGRDAANGGVVYDMVDEEIDLNVNDVLLEGIYFMWSAIATNTDKIDLDGASNCMIRNCIFDASASLAASGFLDIDSTTEAYFQDIALYLNPGTVNAIHGNAMTRCVLERIRITGGNIGAGPLIDLDDCGGNTFDNIDMRSPDTNTGTWHIFEDDNAGTTLGNNWNNITVAGDNQTNGIRLENDESVISRVRLTVTQTGIELAGDRQKISDFTLTGSGGGSGILLSGGNNNVTNGSIASAYTDGIELTGNNNCVSNVATNITGAGQDIDNKSANNTFVNVRTTAGTFENNGSEDARYIACRAAQFNNLGVTTNGTQSFGCNWTAVNDTAGNLGQGMSVHVDAAAPTVNDDTGEGFEVGISFWYRTGTNVLYRCDANGAGAAVWHPVNLAGGIGLYTVLVHPTAGVGDYQTLSAACTGSAAGTIIGVAPGTYTEIAQINMLEGQRIFALGGLEGDDITSVIYGLGNYIISSATDECEISGIYFTVTATADKSFIDLTGNNFKMDKCTFDFTGTAAQDHAGFDFVGCDNVQLREIRIIADARTYEVFSLTTCTNVLVEDVIITGGTLDPSGAATDFIYLSDCSNCKFINIRGSALDTEDIAAYYIKDTVSADTAGNLFRDINLNMTAGGTGGGGIMIEGTGATRNHPTVIDNFVINTTAFNGEVFLNGIQYAKVDKVHGTEIEIDGDSNMVSQSIVTTINIGVTISSTGNKLTGVEVTGTFTNAANADQTKIGNCEFSVFTDLGTNTKRDIFTHETVTGNFDVKGSREYDNDVMGAAVTATWPAGAEVGFEAWFTVMAAQDLIIDAPAGMTIRCDGRSSSVSGNIQSDELYAVIKLVQQNATDIVCKTILGTWDVN